MPLGRSVILTCCRDAFFFSPLCFLHSRLYLKAIAPPICPPPPNPAIGTSRSALHYVTLQSSSQVQDGFNVLMKAANASDVTAAFVRSRFNRCEMKFNVSEQAERNVKT